MKRTDDVSSWPWPLTLEVTAIVGLTRLATLSEHKVQISWYDPHGSDIPCDLVTLMFNLGGHGACRWCGSVSSIRTPTLKFLGLTVRKILHILCVGVNRPVTLSFDLLILKLVRNVARVTQYPLANFGDTTTNCFRFTDHWANTAQTDHVTLRPWFLILEVMAPWLMQVVVLHPYTKFEVRRPRHSKDMAHDVCQR